MSKMRYIVAVVTLTAALAVNLASLYASTKAQANTNRAGLIVQLKDGSALTRCVSFTESEITGYELLRRAQVGIVADIAGGGSVCKIADTGCNFPAQPCFCECQDLNQTCIYWIYYTQVDGAWKYASLGAGIQKASNGAVHGWVYGIGSAASSAVTPPLMTFEQICADAGAPAPTVEPTTPPQPTSAPTTAPTAAPTEVPVAASTATSTPLPVSTPSQPPDGTSPAGATPAPAPVQPTPTSTKSPATIEAQTTATTTPPVESTIVAGTTATLQPAETPSQVPTADVTVVPADAGDTGQDAPASTSYLVFGGIAAALVLVLLFTRRGPATPKS